MKLKVIGVGGCGCCVVNSISKKNIGDVHFVQIDTEKELSSRTAMTDALGVESYDPDLGEKISNILTENSNILIVAGLGGSYSLDIIITLCSEYHKVHAEEGFIWVFAVMPFDFERRDKRAAESLAKVNEVASKVITFDNNTLRQYMDKPMNEAFAVVDQRVCEVVETALSLSYLSPQQEKRFCQTP